MLFSFTLIIARITPIKKNQEIKSAYFGDETFSIFSVCCYFRGNGGKLKTSNVTVTLEAAELSRIVPHTFIFKVLEEVTKQSQRFSRFVSGVMDVLPSFVYVLCSI